MRTLPDLYRSKGWTYYARVNLGGKQIRRRFRSGTMICSYRSGCGLASFLALLCSEGDEGLCQG